MSEIIDSLCGATASCDTLVVKVVKAADVVCQPIIKEAETSCNDVMIVGIICVAIVLVAWLAKSAILSWKDAEIDAAKEERGEKESEAVSLILSDSGYGKIDIRKDLNGIQRMILARND